ncbi:hypothetical protein [Chitinophaga solisilvae]|uniref:hypothetical protein n=1 Tax=Chitinophaga solisilvae TaxID=1233460 RepID=UPI00136EE089|nr:hypothetical protein [Chitinophaga solisilvae]
MLNILQQNGGSSSFQRLYPWPQGSDRQPAFILPDQTAGGILQVDARKETEIIKGHCFTMPDLHNHTQAAYMKQPPGLWFPEAEQIKESGTMVN